MSGEVINLRLAKKRRNRREKENSAEQNRITHGLTKAEKKLNKSVREKHDKLVDQSKLETIKRSDDDIPSN